MSTVFPELEYLSRMPQRAPVGTVPGPDLRPGMVAILEILSNEDDQLAYERDRPHVDVEVEKIGQWFDKAWRPGDPAYHRSFSAVERGALEQFAALFHQQLRDLPEWVHMLRSWLSLPGGRYLMASAREVLHLLQGNGK